MLKIKDLVKESRELRERLDEIKTHFEELTKEKNAMKAELTEDKEFLKNLVLHLISKPIETRDKDGKIIERSWNFPRSLGRIY